MLLKEEVRHYYYNINSIIIKYCHRWFFYLILKYFYTLLYFEYILLFKLLYVLSNFKHRACCGVFFFTLRVPSLCAHKYVLFCYMPFKCLSSLCFFYPLHILLHSFSVLQLESHNPEPPFLLIQPAGWTLRTWGSIWPGCTTSTCSSLASMSWSPGKSPSSTPSSSPPSPWWSTPHMSLCPSTCAWRWSFSLGSLVASLRAPWHLWTKRRGEYGGKRQRLGGLAWFPKSFHITQLFISWSTLSLSLHYLHPKPQLSVTSAHQDWKHNTLNGMIWKWEPFCPLYIHNPLALPHGIKHVTVHYFYTLVKSWLSLMFLFFSMYTSCPVWVHTTCGFAW